MQKSIFTCTDFDLTFSHEQAHAFLWTTKFQCGQVNPKSYLPSLATKVYGSVCSTRALGIHTELEYKWTGDFSTGFKNNILLTLHLADSIYLAQTWCPNFTDNLHHTPVYTGMNFNIDLLLMVKFVNTSVLNNSSLVALTYFYNLDPTFVPLTCWLFYI